MQLFQLQLRISERKPNNCFFSLLSRHQLLSGETVALFSSPPYHWPLLLTKPKYHACRDDHEPEDVRDSESTRSGGKDEQEELLPTPTATMEI